MGVWGLARPVQPPAAKTLHPHYLPLSLSVDGAFLLHVVRFLFYIYAIFWPGSIVSRVFILL